VPATTEGKPWQRLRGKIAPDIFAAPRTAGDPRNHGSWREVPQKVVRYLENNVLHKPWGDVLALVAAVMMAGRFQVTTVINKLSTLNTRFRVLFEALGLARMDEWDANTHIPAYLKGEILPHETPLTRHRFLMDYNSVSKTLAAWLGGLSEDRQSTYQRFTLPVVPPFLVHGLSRDREIVERQQHTRKAETDALVPRFAAIRAEAHFRFNRVARLRRAYREALRGLEPNPRFPVTFSYEEGGDSDQHSGARAAVVQNLGPAKLRLCTCRWVLLAYCEVRNHRCRCVR
jgi:hypothetical protein